MSTTPIVHTELGALVGSTIETAHGSVARYAGIPFGTAVVGPDRFRAARPAPAWNGVRQSTAFGPDPVQSTDGAFTGLIPGGQVGRVDEDCLTLNVWTPTGEPRQPLPVLVWFYGGAFTIGGSSIPTYDGARLAAEQGIVVVSVNYRVGALGFLDLRSVPGGETADTNCGLRDQRLALEWVKANVAAFGGDPSRVTAFGESAGAGSIMHLLTTPAISEVLTRAIAQSPGIDLTLDAELAAVVAQRFMKRAGAAHVDDLRALPIARLLEVQQQVSTELLFDVGTMVFHPVVDEEFVTATPSVAIAGGASADIALLIGYTADELRLFPDPRADDLDADGLARWTNQYLTTRMGREPDPGAAPSLVNVYRGGGEHDAIAWLRRLGRAPD